MKRSIFVCIFVLLFYPAHGNDGGTVTSLKYVTDELNTRQEEIPANDGKVMTFTNTAGGNAPRDVKESLGTSTSDTSLPTVGAVNTGIATKQEKIGALNTNTVVTYTDTPGTMGQKGIYQDSGTYASQSDNLVQASTFNAALRNGLENEFVCAGNDPVTGNCWLWTVNNETESRSPNLFDINKITTTYIDPRHSSIINNGNGSLTITTTPTNSAASTGKKLSQLAPALEVGKSYIFSINTTGTGKNIVLYAPPNNKHWANGAKKTITQEMLDSIVLLYASGTNTTATIYDIQIEEGDVATPFVPYGNVYIPQNHQ